MKKNKRNILITCAGGSASINMAQQLSARHTIFLADADERSIAPFLGFPFKRIPLGKSKNYLSAIKKLVRIWNIDCIVPGADEELRVISRYSRSAKNVSAVVPNDQFIKKCLNKYELMLELHKLKISSLLPWNTLRHVRYPAIVKPRYGRGSRGVHVVHNRKQLLGYIALYKVHFSDLVVQPYINGTEYTVSVIVNNKNALIGVVPKRVILKRGITRVAVAERHKAIEDVCGMIVKKMNPCGPFNVQLMRLKNTLYIFEINPRLSTTSVLTDRAFGNEIDLYIRHENATVIKRKPEFRSGMYLYRYEKNCFRTGRKSLTKYLSDRE